MNSLDVVRTLRSAGFFGPRSNGSVQLRLPDGPVTAPDRPDAVASALTSSFGEAAGPRSLRRGWPAYAAAADPARTWMDPDYGGGHAGHRRLIGGLQRISKLDIGIGDLQDGFLPVLVGGVRAYAAPDRPISLDEDLQVLHYINQRLPQSGRRFRWLRLANGEPVAFALADKEQAILETRLGLRFDAPSVKARQQALDPFLREARRLGFFTGTHAPRAGEPGWLHTVESRQSMDWGALDEQSLSRQMRKWLRPLPNVVEPTQAWAVLALDLSRTHHFDTESAGPDEDGYVDLLHALARISRGHMKVDDVAEAWQGETVAVTCRLSGKPVRFGVQNLDDWIDLTIIDDINRHMRGLRFCAGETDGQDVFIVALRKAEHEALGRMGVPVRARLQGAPRPTHETPVDDWLRARKRIADELLDGRIDVACSRADQHVADVERWRGNLISDIHLALAHLLRGTVHVTQGGTGVADFVAAGEIADRGQGWRTYNDTAALAWMCAWSLDPYHLAKHQRAAERAVERARAVDEDHGRRTAGRLSFPPRSRPRVQEPYDAVDLVADLLVSIHPQIIDEYNAQMAWSSDVLDRSEANPSGMTP